MLIHGKKLDDTCISRQYKLGQIIDEQTHFTEHSSSLINIFLVNDPTRVSLVVSANPSWVRIQDATVQYNFFYN